MSEIKKLYDTYYHADKEQFFLKVINFLKPFIMFLAKRVPGYVARCNNNLSYIDIFNIYISFIYTALKKKHGIDIDKIVKSKNPDGNMRLFAKYSIIRYSQTDCELSGSRGLCKPKESQAYGVIKGRIISESYHSDIDDIIKDASKKHKNVANLSKQKIEELKKILKLDIEKKAPDELDWPSPPRFHRFDPLIDSKMKDTLTPDEYNILKTWLLQCGLNKSAAAKKLQRPRAHVTNGVRSALKKLKQVFNPSMLHQVSD